MSNHRGPCSDCPFRKRTFTVLDTLDVDAMIDHVLNFSTFMYCHEDLVHQGRPCIGAARFRHAVFHHRSDPIVHSTPAALLRAHARSKRPGKYGWEY